MNIFGSSNSVDKKAQSVLDDLPEDPALFEILNTVDQKAGEKVDPDDVVSAMRELDEDVDRKLAAVEGEDIDQKDMREAAGAIADRTDMSQAGAMRLISSVVDSIDSMDPSEFTANFGEIVDEYYRGDVDQNALTDSQDTTMNGADSTDDSGTDSDAGDDADVDQKQDDDGGDGGDQMAPLDIVEQMGDSDARDTVETYAESVNKDPQEAAAEWIAENVPGITVEGYGNDGGTDAAAADGDADAGAAADHDRTADQMKDYDQKMDQENLNERIAKAVTSDDVLNELGGAVAQKMLEDDDLTDELGGALAQKMAEDDDLADNLVGAVEQKGDFVTTEDTVVTPSNTDSETVGDAGAITGGNGGDGE